MATATLQHLVVAAALAAVVAIVCRSGRLGPVARHALWLGVLIKLLTPPLLVLQTPWAMPELSAMTSGILSDWRGAIDPPAKAGSQVTLQTTALAVLGPGDQMSDVPVDAAAGPGSGIRTSGISVKSSRALPLRAATLVSLAIATWAAAALVFLLVQGLRIARVRARLRRSSPPDLMEIQSRVDALARRLNMRSVPVRVVPGLASPLIWGVGRAQLLWPAELPVTLSETCVDGLIVHELAHVKRRDHWVGWLELAAGTVWWWNPLFWYVRTQVREHAELACDAWVVNTLPRGRRAYAEALVAICDVMSNYPPPVPAVGINSGTRRGLERRLIMIMRGRTSSRLSRFGMAGVTMLVAMTLPVWAQKVTPQVAVPVTVPLEVQRPVVRIDRSGTTLPVVAQAQVTVPVDVVTTSAPQVTLEPVQTVPRKAVRQNRAQQALPPDAQQIIDRYAKQEEEQHRKLIQELQAVQDTLTKAGKLDEAVAVRDRIRQLEAAGVGDRWQISDVSPSFTWAVSRPVTTTKFDRAWTIGYAEGNGIPGSPVTRLDALRSWTGETFTLPVIGTTTGQIWGDGIYTDDSPLSTAAVHAGLVEAGKLGFVKVTMLPGQDHYAAATKHGVTSGTYGSFEGSYKLERETSATPVIRIPPDADVRSFISFEALRGQKDLVLSLEIVGTTSGAVWGSDVYTDDSTLGAAAVHAGLLRDGQRGVVKVHFLPGQKAYAGVSRNGVESHDFGEYQGSFRFDK